MEPRAGGPRLKAAAFGELFDLLEDEGGLVAFARVLVPPAHLDQRGVTLGGAGEPMRAVPLGPEEVPERIAGRKADANAVGLLPLDGRGAKVVELADTHGEQAYQA